MIVECVTIVVRASRRTPNAAPPGFPRAPACGSVMPVLNEREYLARAVETVLAQDVPGPIEPLVLALGPSADGATKLAGRIADDDARVRLVDNPAADIPVGLNAAIRASRYPTIVRVDAHSELTTGYTARALDTLDRTGAANVGGVMSSFRPHALPARRRPRIQLPHRARRRGVPFRRRRR